MYIYTVVQSIISCKPNCSFVLVMEFLAMDWRHHCPCDVVIQVRRDRGNIYMLGAPIYKNISKKDRSS
jgi:hypothetical protein